MLFSIGTVEITPRAATALAAVQGGVAAYLDRHQSGDWGEDADDRAFSDFALREGHQITSNYTLPDGTNIFIMTAVDRVSTRVLLADEFEVQEVDIQTGYAIWSSSYDIEKNPLIAIEEPRVDAPIREVPDGFLHDSLRQAHGDTPICLIILAQKPNEADDRHMHTPDTRT